MNGLPALLFQAKHRPTCPIGDPASRSQVQDDARKAQNQERGSQKQRRESFDLKLHGSFSF
jgi:hypothetical protein